MNDEHQPPRYRPEDPWPPYAYLPGHGPHPTRDRDGHSHGHHIDEGLSREPQHWSECPRYLRGADLYNHGYGWEAHEVWEAMWNHPRDRVQAEMLQGLIQLAAATVQHRNDHARGRNRLCQRSAGHLERVAELRGDHYMGLDLHDLIATIREFGDKGERHPILMLSDAPQA